MYGSRMELDGRRQRNALTAAERAIESLAAGQRRAAVNAAERAAELDQISAFAGLPDAVGAAGDPVDEASWQRIRSSVPPGPLHALIDAVQANDHG